MIRPKSWLVPCVLLVCSAGGVSACLQVLDIEEARLDPAEGAELQGADTVLSEEGAVEACDLSFDNTRVTRLVGGQLTPLPEENAP